jgi:radical SAM superfamily enzyme YgiQ (UPF0313 family)
MRYEGIVIRPPSEAESLVLQATFGCSHNHCTFCPTYKGTHLRVKPWERFAADVDEMAARPWRRVFLADGDALVLPARLLLPRLKYVKEKVRGVERIGIYGNAKAVLKHSVEELRKFREAGLGIVYFGLESGDPQVLRDIRKGSTPERMISAAKRVKEAGILLSVTVLLGIAGQERGREHALATARVLSEMDPDFVGALTVMIVPGTPLHDRMERGEFALPDEFAMLEELGVMIANTEATDCLFMSNHASNYLPIKARLPADRERAVRAIRETIERRDKRRLRPEWSRAL